MFGFSVDYKTFDTSNILVNFDPTFINLHPNEYSHEFHYYRFVVKLDRWVKVAMLLMTYLI